MCVLVDTGVELVSSGKSLVDLADSDSNFDGVQQVIVPKRYRDLSG